MATTRDSRGTVGVVCHRDLHPFELRSRRRVDPLLFRLGDSPRLRRCSSRFRHVRLLLVCCSSPLVLVQRTNRRGRVAADVVVILRCRCSPEPVITLRHKIVGGAGLACAAGFGPSPRSAPAAVLAVPPGPQSLSVGRRARDDAGDQRDRVSLTTRQQGVASRSRPARELAPRRGRVRDASPRYRTTRRPAATFPPRTDSARAPAIALSVALASQRIGARERVVSAFVIGIRTPSRRRRLLLIGSLYVCSRTSVPRGARGRLDREEEPILDPPARAVRIRACR